MILTAVAIATNLDINFDQFVAEEIPNVNLTAAFECSPTVTAHLHEVTGRQATFDPATASSACDGSASTSGSRPRATPARRRCWRTPGAARSRPGARIHRNPGLVQHAGRPAADAGGLRGRVVLIDFWTYTCINCIRTLPYLKAWDAAYARTA